VIGAGEATRPGCKSFGPGARHRGSQDTHRAGEEKDPQTQANPGRARLQASRHRPA
jgi:hypothetical protein